MKKIFVISAGRSDYDRYLPIIEELKKNPKVDLYLILSSAHYASKFGSTFNFVAKDFKVIKPKKIYKSYPDRAFWLVNRFSEDLKFLSITPYFSRVSFVQ